MARKWWTLIAVSVATFMLLLDITVVNVALPSIREDLGASFTDLQWVVDAYALTLAALVLTAGSLADRLGRRRVFVVGLGIFSRASLLCALAPDPTFLNLARALQGIGGAVMFAVSLALIAQEFPAGRERGNGDGHLRRHDRRGRRDRPARRRRAHRRRSAGSRSSTSTCRSGWRRSPSPTPRLRESRDPNATRVDWAGRGHLQRRALHAGPGARPRQRRGLGQHADRLAVRGLRRAAGRLRGDREPRARADAAARALPAAGVHRRPARGVRDLGLGLRAVPLHRRSTCRTTSATRRSQAGLRYLPITLAAFFVVAGRGRAAALAGPGAGAAERRPRRCRARACC